MGGINHQTWGGLWHCFTHINPLEVSEMPPGVRQYENPIATESQGPTGSSRSRSPTTAVGTNLAKNARVEGLGICQSFHNSSIGFDPSL